MLPITKKIFRDLAREKTFLLTIFLQVLIIVSMSILLSYTTLYFNPEMALKEPAKIGYNPGTQFADYLKDVKLYEVERNKGISMVENGLLDVYIDEEGNVIKIHLPNDKLRQMIYLSILKTPLDKYESHRYNDKRLIEIDKIKTAKTKGIDVMFETLYGFLIPFIFLLPIFMIGTLLIDIISEDIETKRIELLLTSTNMRNILYQTLIAGIALIAIEELLWVGLIVWKGIMLYRIKELFLYLILLSIFVLVSSLIIVLATGKKAKAQLIYAVFVILLTAITNVSLFSPVNSIVAIIIGIIHVPYFIYLFWAILIIISIFVLEKLSIKAV